MSKVLTKYFEGLLWALAALCPILAAVVTERRTLGVIAIIWVLSTAIVIPLHFWKAWRRLPTAANKGQYAAWVGFETVLILALISLIVHGVIDRGGAVVR